MYYPIGWLLKLQQPDVYEEIMKRFPTVKRVDLQEIPDVVIVEIVSDDLTKEQKELRRLMMIKPGWDRSKEVE